MPSLLGSPYKYPNDSSSRLIFGTSWRGGVRSGDNLGDDSRLRCGWLHHDIFSVLLEHRLGRTLSYRRACVRGKTSRRAWSYELAGRRAGGEGVKYVTSRADAGVVRPMTNPQTTCYLRRPQATVLPSLSGHSEA
ncbi:hypothetical protein Pcinc_043509 [Petrolisthes cinctipes]|uniref:Uncharacterized protein n=1 Tax=Petrolisthes cinctipes TaxID=88211 RepID=A0AAE1BFR7_PETCI|nr:hypothetical protein Pcinc_043509 [Petrolisthes cinctipes]